MDSSTDKLIVDYLYKDMRIELFLSRISSTPATFFMRQIRNKKVLVNNKKVEIGYRIKEGDLIFFPKTKKEEKPLINRYSPDFIKKMIIYENKYFIFLNKPVNIATQGGTSVKESIDEGIQFCFPNNRALILHRLDKGTSGLLALAKDRLSAKYFGNLIMKRKIKKTYLAIVKGYIEEEGTIDIPLLKVHKKVIPSSEGQESITLYKRIKFNGKYSLVEVYPYTGRTHQIRVHLSQIGFPIVGDPLYEGEENKRLRLHSSSLIINSLKVTAYPMDFFEGFKDLI